MDKNELLDLIPAYALDALDPEERASVEALLAADEDARHLLAEYRQVAELLVFAAPGQPAPAHLTEDLRRRLAARRGRSSLARRHRRWGRALLLVAALLLLAVGAILVLTRPVTPPNPAERYATLAAQENALRIPLVPGEGQEQVSGELVAAPDGRQAVIQVVNLPPLGPDQTFQLWVRPVEGDVYSGGLFRAEGSPEMYIVLPLGEQPLQRFAGFGVSIEPAGGSPYPDRPTGPRVFAVQLDM